MTKKVDFKVSFRISGFKHRKPRFIVTNENIKSAFSATRDIARVKQLSERWAHEDCAVLLICTSCNSSRLWEKISKGMRAGGNEVLQWNSLHTSLLNLYKEHMTDETHQAGTVTAMCCGSGTNGTNGSTQSADHALTSNRSLRSVQWRYCSSTHVMLTTLLSYVKFSQNIVSVLWRWATHKRDAP